MKGFHGVVGFRGFGFKGLGFRGKDLGFRVLGDCLHISFFQGVPIDLKSRGIVWGWW